MKRGISPLVSWVLLIGFSVAAGILITQWAISIAQNVEFPEDKETYCNEVQLEFEDLCLSGDTAHINLKNNGAFTIKRLGLGRKTTSFGKEWCIYLIPSMEWIEPGTTTTDPIIFKAGTENGEYNSLGDTDCNSLTGGHNFIGGTVELLELEIIPWIKPGEEAIQCFEKGILLNITEDTINNQC